ncbi:hypothetical protein EXIGLDRAFT_779532 [Exidia glandulosa HHB12029]|uniref:Uncharacterized protein n=1 Tax=Exidia glandulosa HHB12029 TaxID=1314781 RepID=A0A165C0P2_EXIGL|nr:hypothetical protein EXIGLDRAFT_779532 [Exidia glandulosa HHB12029]
MSQNNTPQEGEIWVARASVLLSALRAASMFSAESPTIVMKAEKDRLEMGQDVPDVRPCIVFDAGDENTLQLIPTTTLQGQPLHLVNGHVRHFVVPFGEHDDDGVTGTTVRPTTTWPKSTTMPTYIFAYPLDVKRSVVTSRYRYNGGTFTLDRAELVKLQQICSAKLSEYKSKPKREMRRYHDSWIEDKLRRKERWAAGSASAPPEPLSASRTADVTPAFPRGVGVSQRLQSTAPRRLNSVTESSPSSANAPPPMALDLSIDDDDADRTDEWPSLSKAYAQNGSPTEELRAKGRATSASGLLESQDATIGQRNAWASPPAIVKALRGEERASHPVAKSGQTVDVPAPPTDAALRADASAEATIPEDGWITQKRKSKKKPSISGSGALGNSP